MQRNPASATRTNDGRLPIDPPFLTVLRELTSQHRVLLIPAAPFAGAGADQIPRTHPERSERRLRPSRWLPVDPPLGDEELTLRQQVDPGCKRNGIELLFPVDPAAGAPRPTIRPRAGPRPGIVCSLSVGRKLV